MRKVVIFIAEGFEECEALIVADILRRGKIDVLLVSINDTKVVTSSHDVKIYCDKTINNIDINEYDMIVLPGGMPGTLNLDNCDFVKKAICDFNKCNKKIAAICAAPLILDKAGILDDKEAIIHKNFRNELKNGKIKIEEVVVDNNITTAWGLGAAIPFGLELLRQFTDDDTVNRVKNSIDYIH